MMSLLEAVSPTSRKLLKHHKPAKNSPAMMEVFAAIARERVRQRELLLAGNITFDVASPIPDDNRKLRVLVEEVGEVAEAMDRLEQNAPNKRQHRIARANIREELIQVAAVAVAWLESLEFADQNRCIKNECVYPGHCNCPACVMDRRMS